MDYGKSKFENAKAEELYALDPDASIGSVEELGWAGLFRDDLAILIEDSQGFAWVSVYDSEAEMLKGWAEIEEDYEAFYLGVLV